MMRSSTIDVLRLDYVTHARAKGLSERTVLMRHVFPNAFAPTLTLVGLTLGRLFGGIAVIETVFTLPGLGRLMVDSVLARDYPVVQGCLLFTATLYVLVNLLVRSEEHTSELQSLMRISYAVLCLKKKII